MGPTRESQRERGAVVKLAVRQAANVGVPETRGDRWIDDADIPRIMEQHHPLCRRAVIGSVGHPRARIEVTR